MRGGLPAGRITSVRLSVILGLLLGCGTSAPSSEPPPPRAISPRAPELHYEGRFDESDPAGPRFEWPGSAVWLRFTGTSVKAVIGEHSLENDEYGKVAHNWYDAWVDGQLVASLRVADGVQTYPLAQGLPPREHQLVLRKRTEAYVGVGQFLGFELDPGATALPVAAPSRRIEFIGDSITAGFGVDGADSSCLFSAETENYSHSYGALTAQALGAEQIAVAATGAGAYRNWDGGTENSIGDLYERTLPTVPAIRWNFSRFSPDVVVLDLGTNDFSSGDPGRDLFIGAYRKLLARVRQNYPSALLVLAVGPMLSDLWPAGARALTQGRSYISDVVAQLAQAGDARIKLIEFPNQDHEVSFGCKWHPSAASHRRMGEQLTVFLRQQMGW